jgi:hypothetical protein
MENESSSADVDTADEYSRQKCKQALTGVVLFMSTFLLPFRYCRFRQHDENHYVKHLWPTATHAGRIGRTRIQSNEIF